MFNLNEISTLPPEGIGKEYCKKELYEFHKQLFELQNVFYADGRFGLLIILQGMDTSGKDGTIRHVMTCMNPMGLYVHSFKKPTDEELKHDFLWRVYSHIPPKSMIQVFNRSYYEDIIMPAVNESQSVDRIQHRKNLINELEQHLVQNDIHVLKFFLHISPEEQKERIKERLSKPHKRWKYSKEDDEASINWNDYNNAYNSIIADCNNIPWQIIPSDKRWYRNYLVAKEITSYLKNLNLKYPNI